MVGTNFKTFLENPKEEMEGNVSVGKRADLSFRERVVTG